MTDDEYAKISQINEEIQKSGISTLMQSEEFQQIQRVFAKLGEDYRNSLFKVAETIGTSVIQQLSSIQIPSIQIPVFDSKNSVSKKIYEAMTSWGVQGWYFLPEVPINKTYWIKVSSIEEADKIMSQYCQEDIINALIQRDNEWLVNNNIYDEAIDCLKAHKFTACILLLYSLIDSFFIRLQQNESSSSSIKLAFKKASLLLKNDPTDLMNKENARITAGPATALMAVKTHFFTDYNFQNEPNCVNRNFISHGMSNRKVTKLDCIKVLTIIDGIYTTKKRLCWGLSDNLEPKTITREGE